MNDTQPIAGLDAAFLSLETASAPLHVMGVIVVDTHDTTPHVFFERLRSLLEQRVPDIAALRRSLVPGVLDPDRWVECDDLDPAHHLYRHALPAPGDRDELCRCVAAIGEKPLDRTRPLWEMHVIEGLRRRRTAIVTKIHHSVIDGTAGAELMARLFDLEPEIPQPRDATQSQSQSRANPAQSAQRPAGTRRGHALSLLRLPQRIGARVGRTALALGRLGWLAARDRSVRESSLLGSAPQTAIDGSIGAARAVALADVDFAEVREIAQTFGTKVNDVVLAATTNALRRLLVASQELPGEPLLAAIPVARAADAKQSNGNSLSAMLAHLPVEVADPVDQLLAVHRSTRTSKRMHEAVGSELLQDWADLAPQGLLSTLSNLYARHDLAATHRPLCNLIVSNVAGPPFPLYCAGARVDACHPLGPIYDGIALNITVLSYDGRLHFGAIACPERVPDLGALARGFVSSIGALRLRAHEARVRSDQARSHTSETAGDATGALGVLGDGPERRPPHGKSATA